MDPDTTLADPLAGAEDWPAPPDLPEPNGDGADPEAPWGRRADGTPRNKPGPRPTGGGGKPTAPPPPKKAGKPKPPPKRTRPDYRPGITALLSLPAGLVGAAGATLGRRELVADAATIMAHAPGLAGGLDELAGQDPRVAAVLDRVLQAGPYGALITAVVPMAAQILANHGILKPGQMGTMPPEDLVQAYAQGANGASADHSQG